MQRRALMIEYDGTDFCGWQLQPKVRTVQGELEKAIARASGSEDRIVLHGASRTDAGVHARAQVAHFDSHCKHAPHTYKHAINFWLKTHDVSVRAVRNVKKDFHARFSAEKKTYRFSIVISETKRPLHERYCIRLPKKPDIGILNECAALTEGRHDFASFTASGADTSTTVKHIYSSGWIARGDFLHFLITGDGFTYNMVRTLVGSMVEAALKTGSCDGFKAALAGKKRVLAGPTAPPRGLVLSRIEYPADLAPFSNESQSRCIPAHNPV